jgi:AmmeMemoRadiSam system protein A
MLGFAAVMLPPTSRTALLDVARRALLHRLRAGGILFPPVEAPADFPDLCSPSGCFVSLHERQTGRLRGCVGRLDPEKPVWEAVCLTACDVLRDPRFTDRPVVLEEAALLEIEVSVLSPPREAATPTDFDLLEHGIYLILGTKAGFFLPQVARDTGWGKEQLLARLCTEKLGLPAEAWQKPEAKLFTFSVDVIGPEPVLLEPLNDPA